MNTLVFDIETVPDVELGRKLYESADLDDASVAKIMFFKNKQARGTDFLPLVQHRVVVISAVLESHGELRIFSLDEAEGGEKQIVQRFFDGLERYSPELVSWNGSGFDLPVLHYRALRHGVTASRYWETGDSDREFRYNNYLNRFHWRHLDLMDILAGYQSGGRASLEHVAQLLGLPGKLGMSGANVWDQYRAGKLGEIRDYCETDVLNTYLVFLRFQLLRGLIDPAEHGRRVHRLVEKLRGSDRAHLKTFLESWLAADPAVADV